jgi:hypothetical protein
MAGHKREAYTTRPIQMDSKASVSRDQNDMIHLRTSYNAIIHATLALTPACNGIGGIRYIVRLESRIRDRTDEKCQHGISGFVIASIGGTPQTGISATATVVQLTRTAVRNRRVYCVCSIVSLNSITSLEVSRVISS